MKLIYIYIGGSKKTTSVQRKVISQIAELNNQGINTIGWFYNESNEIEELINENIILKPLNKLGKSPLFFLGYFRVKHIHQQVLDQISHESFDILFIRHFGNSGLYFKLLNKYAKKTILYMPSNPVSEGFQERKANESNSLISGIFKWFEYFLFIYISHYYLYKVIFPKLKAIVAYTPEFCNILNHKSGNKSRMIYNRDGIDANRVPIRKLNYVNKEVYRLIFLKGSAVKQPWAGLDRLIKSIMACKGINFHLYICGNVIDKENYNYDFITLTGTLSGNELDDLIDNVDIGVSNLANYLIGFNETTNMKSREYFARGLPFIQANKMPDIDNYDVKKYYLNIDNNDSLIDMFKVKDFIDRIRKDKYHPIIMREFSQQHLDWNITVRELADSIREIENQN
jgi:hypothetical protein